MTYEIIPLRILISTLQQDRVHDILSKFTCTRDEGVQRYLRNNAISHEKRHVSRSYLVVNKSNEIAAYFTIAISSISAENVNCSRKIRQNLNINENTAQTYLIGQIGKSDGQPKGIGRLALRYAINLINDLNLKIGCKVIRVDCADVLMDYYEQNGFTFIKRAESNSLNQMVKIIS